MAYEQMAHSFKTFLEGAVKKGGPLKEHHAIFSCGTTVRFKPENEEFMGFEDSEYEFPTHRLKNQDDSSILEDILEHNQGVFDKIFEFKTELKDYQKLVSTAYNKLIEDGYPYPGGEGADRIAIPMSELDELPPNCALVLFFHRNPNVMNLIVPKMIKKGAPQLTNIQLAGLGGDARRNDYMEPHLVCLIEPDLTVHMVNVDKD
jgi:hypothetical protein